MISRRTPTLLATALAVLLFVDASVSLADPIAFNIINPSGNQSRINMTASGSLFGGALTVEPQVAPGGFNGLGSLTTLYGGTIQTNLTQQWLGLPGGSAAAAATTKGSLNQNLALTPNVGGTTGTGPGNYGVRLFAPFEYDLPSIPVQGVEIDLGKVTGVNLNVALRNVVLDISGSNTQLLPYSALPQTFDASGIDISMTGNADISLTAALKQDNILAYFANLVVLQGLASSQPALGLTIAGNLATTTINIGLATTVAIPATSIENLGAGSGSLAQVGPNYRLTLPVNINLSDIAGDLSALLDLQLGFNGQLVAEAPYQAVSVPEPSSLVLGAIAASSLALVIRRRRRSA